MVIGDSEGHVGLGIKTSKEVATAIRAAIIIAKLSVLPIRRGYWGANLGDPHSLPTKESGKCGSVTVRVCLSLCSYLKEGDAKEMEADVITAYSCAPWYRSRCLASRQAFTPALRCARCLHFLRWIDEDVRKYPQGYVRGCRQHLWLLDTESVEGDEAE